MSSFRTTAARLAVAAALTVGIAGTSTAAFALPPVGPGGGPVVGPIGPGGDHPEVGDIDDLTIYDPCVVDDECPNPDPDPEPEDEADPSEDEDPGSDDHDPAEEAEVDDAVVARPTFTG